MWEHAAAVLILIFWLGLGVALATRPEKFREIALRDSAPLPMWPRVNGKYVNSPTYLVMCRLAGIVSILFLNRSTSGIAASRVQLDRTPFSDVLN